MTGVGVIVFYVCPTLGVILANFMWVSPFPAVYSARLSRDLGATNPIPFVFMLLNCMGWTIYACQLKDWFIFWANLPGVLLSLFYTTTCLSLLANRALHDDISLLYHGIEGFLLFVFLFWGLIGMISASVTKYPVIGLLSLIVSVAYYASPLSTMVKVIRKKNSETLYFPMIAANLVNAILWTAYGAFAIYNMNLWIPNAIGIVLATCQLILIVPYSRKPNFDSDKMMLMP